MTQQHSTRWVHRPQDGPVAWWAAVITAPAVPLLSSFSLLLLFAVVPGDRDELRIVLSPVPWLVVGGLMMWLASGRVTRGVGLGMLSGAVVSLFLAVLASHGGWK